MELIVLGSSGSSPAPGNPSSSYLVRHESVTLLLDAGPGSFMTLLEKCDPLDLDAVLVSHGHADHCGDLLALGHYLAYGPGQGAMVRVLAAPGVAERLRGFTGDGDPDHPMSRALSFEPPTPSCFGDVAVDFVAANHSVPAVAMRLDAAGSSLVYTGDTGPSAAIEELARDVDLLVAEATWQGEGDPNWPFHMTAAQAGEMGRRAGAERLMLTHIRPALDPQRSAAEAAETFGATPMVALPGLTVTFDQPTRT